MVPQKTTDVDVSGRLGCMISFEWYWISTQKRSSVITLKNHYLWQEDGG